VQGAGWWAYALVFLAAAVPVIEVLVVVPAAVVAGLSPAWSTMLAIAGNTATVALAVVAGDRVRSRWRGGSSGERSRRRSQRAVRIARRWGVPGLALLAPITTGSHVAALGALALGDERRRVVAWMSVGIALWAVAAMVAAMGGVALLGDAWTGTA
jgi:uncharacterized membrane protein